MSMRRRPAGSLYSHAFQPALAKAFPVSLDVPETMQAILAQLDEVRPAAGSPSARLDALKELADREARSAEAAATATVRSV